VCDIKAEIENGGAESEGRAHSEGSEGYGGVESSQSGGNEETGNLVELAAGKNMT